ncbi:protein kinase [Achlya hypogyna]|uniref:Protein kinase n=1 Tax=Achlya hypogyna TaxID=1202772 RepID=A0A1V9YMS9_ACHHY|nr:protein kinase [Achlya hypogyna]
MNTLYGNCAAAANGALASPDPCVVYGDNRTTLVTASPAFGLRSANVEVVQGLPSVATSVDLSNNSIYRMTFDRQPNVVSLNLSRNMISSLDAVASLPNLETLDLSMNKLTTWTNAGALPNLTALNLSGNQIRSLYRPTFPPSLVSLDLSGNPITSFDLTTATYNALSVLPILRLSGVSITTCAGTLRLLGRTVVCVVDTPHESTSLLTSTYGQLIVVFSCIGLFTLAYLICVKGIFSSDRSDDASLRDTCVSSAYSIMADDPMEYRISLSIEMDPKPFEAVLHHDPLLQPRALAMKDVKKVKLLATAAYTRYVAEHHGAKVHAKVLTPLDNPQPLLAGLVNELAMLARLDHPNVVALVGFATSSSLLDLTVVTEFVALDTVASVLGDVDTAKYLRWTTTNAIMPPKVEMARDVAAAVAYLHSKGVLHNAISTETTFVSSKWTVKLGDFTHSSYEDDPKTCAVAAPEVLAGGSRSSKSDVYLLGHFISALETSDRALIPASVQAIIDLCVQDDPQARPDATEVVAMLQRCAESPAPSEPQP